MHPLGSYVHTDTHICHIASTLCRQFTGSQHVHHLHHTHAASLVSVSGSHLRRSEIHHRFAVSYISAVYPMPHTQNHSSHIQLYILESPWVFCRITQISPKILVTSYIDPWPHEVSCLPHHHKPIFMSYSIVQIVSTRVLTGTGL